jgi:hypothetical protein
MNGIINQQSSQPRDPLQQAMESPDYAMGNYTIIRIAENVLNSNQCKVIEN